MGGGDLNMKKSWHPVLLVNQERVWKAEKSANEEKKMLAQLRKEREEERQLAELQSMQEAATGKKRVEKLDWMYAAPGTEGGALGGQRIGEREMEDYLLGKRRVDEVLAQGDRNVGNMHKDFIAVQNANTVRDTQSKIREDPLLAIKRQELAAMEAMKNRPEIRRKMMELQKGGESKEDRKAKRRAEKEDRRRERAERREERERRHARGGRDGRDRDRDRSRSRSRSPRSDYSSDREYRTERRDRGSVKSEHRSRSLSPRRGSRDGHRDRDGKRRDDSRDRYRDNSQSRGGYDSRVPPPRNYDGNVRENGNGNGASHGYGHGHANGNRGAYRPHPSRPSAMDMVDRERPSDGPSRASNPHSAPRFNGSGNANGSGSNNSNGNEMSLSLEQQRAARLAAMSASAQDLDASRTKSLAQRAEEEKKEMEKEERMRKKYTSDDVKGVFFGQKSEMGLGEVMSRRAGRGLQRDI